MAYQVSLAAARVNANLTQIQAAKKIGVSKDSIIKWEAGKASPSATKFKKLCAVYGVPMDIIFLPESLL